MFNLLFDVPTISLGPIGAALYTFFSACLALATVAMGVFTWRQKTWKSTAESAMSEMAVHKEAANRLRDSNTALIERVAKLEVQTDLNPLVLSIHAWVTEGRERFSAAMTRLDTIHVEQSTTLKALLEEMHAQRGTSETAYRELSNSFQSHSIDDKEFHLRFVGMMDNVERRLSSVAIQIGLPEWTSAQKSTSTSAAS